MRPSTLLIALSASCVLSKDVISELSSSAKISVQTIGFPTVSVLADVQYNSESLEAEIISYEPPELPQDSELVRIGIFDSKRNTWASSTTVTSVESFSKGYAPIIAISLDTGGHVLSVAIKSAKVDAGQTRDFGPKVKIIGASQGKLPELNRPVILKDGKVEEAPPEKTLLQKYWWVGAAVLVLMVAGGGDGK